MRNFDLKIHMQVKTRKIDKKKQKGHRMWLALGIILIVVGLFLITTGPSSGMKLAKFIIPIAFSKTKHISTREWKEFSDSEDWVIVDVRSEEEFERSHLAGSIHLPHQFEKLPEYFKSLPKDQKILIYCAAGYRSALACKKFRQYGFTEILNLNGGIFDWANEGEPFEGMKIHPHSPMGHWLVKKEFL